MEPGMFINGSNKVELNKWNFNKNISEKTINRSVRNKISRVEYVNFYDLFSPLANNVFYDAPAYNRIDSAGTDFSGSTIVESTPNKLWGLLPAKLRQGFAKPVVQKKVRFKENGKFFNSNGEELAGKYTNRWLRNYKRAKYKGMQLWQNPKLFTKQQLKFKITKKYELNK
ncbi:hypothetical protein DAMA08_020120 [Martiniozyma asiatica (nom. inval.)]|nr:hypothetical protein DAMA08_020120 [Martiniozyma asiatica]